MDDVIYRKDAAKILCNWCGVCPEDKRDIMICDDICPEFARIPSAQKKGHWMPIIEANENGEPYQSGVYCSECGFPNTTEDNFCSECGADMREDGETDG